MSLDGAAIQTALRVVKGAVVRVLGVPTGQSTQSTRVHSDTEAVICVKLAEPVRGLRG
jgi:hypothetical protein